MPQINRSKGISTGHLGLVAGGGYVGATHELDAQVERAAELLRKAYDMDVTIRFNSDRKSGGAWLVTSEEDGFGRNADIGITVALIRIDDLKPLFEDLKNIPDFGTLDDRLREDGIDPANPPASYLLVSAHIGNAALSEPSVANSSVDEPDRRYAHVKVNSIEDALAYLQANAVLPKHVRSRASTPTLR